MNAGVVVCIVVSVGILGGYEAKVVFQCILVENYFLQNKGHA